LYYRLAVVPIRLPPLRERREDIPIFVRQFFEHLKRKYGRPEMELPSMLMPYFVDYNWPGNIRELENVLERIVLLGRSDEVAREDVPEQLRRAPASLEAVERRLIVQALQRFNWNQSQAARHLDISRKTLMYRIAKYGIERELSDYQSKSAESGEE
jgi:DNA-binding NtrC family response regulator